MRKSSHALTGSLPKFALFTRKFLGKTFLPCFIFLIWFTEKASLQPPLPLENSVQRIEICLQVMSVSAKSCRANAAIAVPICAAVIDYYEKVRPPFSFRQLVFLTAALIKRESCFNPRAVSPKRAVGLMQIHYPYWKSRFPELRISDLYDPYFNVSFALWILDVEWRRTNSLKKTLALYGGWGNHRHRKARAYIQKVLREVYLLEKWWKESKS